MLHRRYSICIRNIYLMYNYHVYNNLLWSNRLQSMHNHMVGRVASVLSPFCVLLPGSPFSFYITIDVCPLKRPTENPKWATKFHKMCWQKTKKLRIFFYFLWRRNDMVSQLTWTMDMASRRLDRISKDLAL